MDLDILSEIVAYMVIISVTFLALGFVSICLSTVPYNRRSFDCTSTKPAPRI